ncbi:MAG: retron system putative HNH endonuclease [Candidatus Merdousia sp.]|nr:retron system putative HNH endonuclease [Candidatus Merdousia sp.]
MRYIPKPAESEAPEAFKRWKKRHPNAKYSSFHNVRAKSALKESLIRRQKFLCCYCESRITEETSHIEHIEPQMGGLSAHTMDYGNMAASCIKDPKKFEEKSEAAQAGVGVLRDAYLHCGHARGTHPVASPYDPVVDELFRYSFGGEIKVSPELSDESKIELARETIDNLRLNVPTLANLRRLAMYETVRLLEAGIPPSVILREINGRLPPFITSAQKAVEAWTRAAETAEKSKQETQCKQEISK